MSILGRFLQPGGGGGDIERRTLMGSNFVPPPAVGVIDDFVGVHRAMAHMTVFACVRLLADTIASLPWKAYRRDSKGVPKPLATQPQLITQPMQGFDLFEWKWMIVASMALRGNSYHYVVERDRNGYPTQILPLHPDIVFLERRPDILMWFEPIYRIMGEPVAKTDMIHMRRFTMPGEPWGMSPIRQAAVAIGLGLSAEEYGYRFYKESATPSGTLQTEQDVDDETLKLIQQNWISSHGGRRLPAVLSKGFKFEPISLRPDECLARGTLLTMADGTRKAVEDITVGDCVMAWNGSKLVSSWVSRVGFPPIKPMVKITTVRGRELVCTVDHPVLGLRALSYPQKESEWILAGDLEAGQHVRVALGHLTEDTTGFNDGIAYFLGAMVGDGNIRKHHPRWFSTDPGVFNHMSAAVEGLGGRIALEGPRNYGIRFGGRSSLISAILNESGLVGCYSHEKFVPEMITAGGPAAWRGFLSGYLDADGYVTRADAQTPRVTINSTSRELLDGVQHLMALLGVNASVAFKPSGGGRRFVIDREYDCRDQWTLNVSGIRQVQKLAEQLDLSHTERRSRLANYLAQSGDTLRRETTDPYDRVKSVELLGDGQSIGVTIESTHTHVTSGLISHNSQFLETRQFQRSEICLLFGVPPILIGDTKECVVAGTLMTMADGGRKLVEELHVGDRVMAWDGSKLVASPVKWVGTPPIKPIVKVTTVRGRELTCTADHPILAKAENRYEWEYAAKLPLGQEVVIATGSVDNGTISYDVVQNVEDLGDGQTVGIEIEGTHTHVTNDIITHNTTAWGCLPGDALVHTTSGPVPIANVKEGDEVWSYDGDGIVKAKVTGWVMTGYKPLMTIKTRGRELQLTSNHKVPVRRYMGVAEGRKPGRGGKEGTCGWETIMVFAGQIRVGDYLIVPHGMGAGEMRCTPEGQELTVGMMEFAGLYLGDGCRGSHQQIIICHGHGRDADHIPHYKQVVEREFGKIANTDTRGTQTRFSSPGAVTLLGSGFTGTAATKRVPGWVFGLAPELQLALLRGYLDADGSVQRGAITYSSVNKDLLEDVRHLCVQLGIPVGVVKLGRAAGLMTIRGKEYQSKEKWELSLSSLQYNVRIGSNSPHKAPRLTELGTDRAGRIGERQRRFRYDPEWTGVAYGNRKPIGPPPANSVYHKVISVSKDSDVHVPVYDIEVKGPAHYVANGIVVSNTGVEQITLGAVTYTFRPWTSLIESAISAQLPRGQFVRFDYNALLRGDMLSRYGALKEAIQGSWMTPNEVRAGEEMDPLDDGDQLLSPPGFMSLGSAEKVAAANAARSAQTPPAKPAESVPAAAPKKPAKKPASLPTPAIGGGEMGGGHSPSGGSRGDRGDMLDKYEQEMRAAYHNHGKPNAILNGEES